MMITTETQTALLSFQRRLAHEVSRPEMSRQAIADVESEFRELLTAMGLPAMAPD